MSETWLAQRDRGSLRAMQWMNWLTLKLGRGAGRVFLYPICWYFVVFSVHARRASRAYLARVLQRKAGLRDIFHHYHTFSSTIHDRIYLLSGRHRYFEVSMHGADALDSAMKRGAGCLLLGSHLGSYEMLLAQGRIDKKFPINVLMHEEHANKINRARNRLYPEIVERVIPLGRPHTLLKVKECLARGEIVGILGDRMFHSDKAVVCSFLGADAPFPAGPFILAALLQAPVVLFFALYRGGKRYEIHFESFAERIAAESPPQAKHMREWVERYVARLEHYCRLAPYNWFNFYDFWGGAA